MGIFPFLVVAWVVVAGLYGIVTSRDLIHLIVCLIVVQSSTYVLLLGDRLRDRRRARRYFFDIPLHTKAVDPVVQALALTDVVVEATVTALLLSLRDPGAEALRDPRPDELAEFGADMDQLYALSVTVPLLAAAALLAARPLFAGHRRVLDVVAVATTASVAVDAAAVLVVRTYGAAPIVLVRRLSGPRAASRSGSTSTADPLGAGLACLARCCDRRRSSFSWRYFDAGRGLFHALMLVFLAGMVGFCLTGDLFDLFVFFELMSVVRLRADRLPAGGARPAPGRPQLRRHQQRRRLPVADRDRAPLRPDRRAEHGPDRPGTWRARPPTASSSIAFVLVSPGFLVKGGDRAVPLLARRRARGRADAGLRALLRRDGRARPVRLRPGVLDGLRRTARPTRPRSRRVFLGAGALTAVVGALFVLRERHLKRLLAFSTVSHAGLFLIGLALLSPRAWRGRRSTGRGTGFVKGALFLCVRHRAAPARLGESRPGCTGAGRQLPVTGVIFTARGPRPGGPAAVRDLPGQGLDRGQRSRAVADRHPPGLRHPRRRRGAAGRGRRVLRARRPAGGGPADGRRGERGDGGDGRGQAADARCRCSYRQPRWRCSAWPPASPPWCRRSPRDWWWRPPGSRTSPRTSPPC